MDKGVPDIPQGGYVSGSEFKCSLCHNVTSVKSPYQLETPRFKDSKLHVYYFSRKKCNVLLFKNQESMVCFGPLPLSVINKMCSLRRGTLG